MKKNCTLMADLLPLYAEGMCSADTSAEIEAHLQECEECKEALARYRAELDKQLADDKKAQQSENAAEVKPLEKVEKKLKHSKLKIVLLVIALLLVIGVVAFLVIGDLTGWWLGFQGHYNLFKCEYICSEFCKGNVEPLVESLPISEEDYMTFYFNRTDSVKEAIEAVDNYRDAYRIFLKKEMKKNWDIYFAEYVGNLAYHLVWEYDSLSTGSPTWYISASFYPKSDGECQAENALYTMDIVSQEMGSFLITELEAKTKEHRPLSAMIKNCNISAQLERTFIQKQYTQLNNGTKRLPTEEEFENYSELYRKLPTDLINVPVTLFHATNGDDAVVVKMRKDILTVFLNGWYFKDSMIFTDHYDDEKGAWISTQQYVLENQETGEICIWQRQYVSNTSKLSMDDYLPDTQLIGGESMPQEIRDILMQLYLY